MGFRKTAIICLTVLLIITAVFCGRVSNALYPYAEETQKPLPMAFFLETGDVSRELVPWRDEQGGYILFLPSCGELDRIRIDIPEKETVMLNRQKLDDWMLCQGFCLGEAYPLRYGNEQNSSITFLRSENLPAVYIDTRSGDMAYIHSLKGSEEPGRLQIVLPDGTQSFSGGLQAFGGRGNATWELEKKPYKLELEQEASLLGMAPAEKWILLSNGFDPSHIRNKTVYDTARQVGLSFSPESRWVDLYLNGEYAGLYVLCEKNEVHPNRVDIDDATGVLISIEKEDRLWEYGGSQFITAGGTPIRVRHSGGEITAVKEKLESLENALAASDGLDPATGKHWSDLIDVESWAKKYLIEEVFGNLDAGSISQFFYWEGDGKIFAGPVWDYDITMGNPNNWQIDLPEMLYAGRPHLWDPEDRPWFYLLYQKPEFREQVMALYEAQFRPVLQALLETEIADSQETIRQAAGLDSLRWSVESSDAATKALVEYMTQRMAFLDSLWIRQETYHLVSVYVKWHVMACYAVPDGGYIGERAVPMGTDTIIYEGWYDEATDQPYDFSTPVTEDKLIYLKETDILPGSTEDGFSLRVMVTYIPAAALLILMLVVLAAERKRRKRNGG